MTNNVKIKLELAENGVLIKADEEEFKTIFVDNKTINTEDIFKMLKYDKNNNYILDCEKINDDEINGDDRELKRLYNYLYELFAQIINAVNTENIFLAK